MSLLPLKLYGDLYLTALQYLKKVVIVPTLPRGIKNIGENRP